MESCMSERKLKRALISVFYKDGLEPIVKHLSKLGVEIISTGGTQNFIQKLGIECTGVEELTSCPSILGGRVKTLHPTIFGGILARRDNPEDAKQCEMYDIPDIDLVIVDLYPFDETVANGGSHDEIIEKIDIGGVSLIRAAAKNYKDVLIVASRELYGQLLQLLEEGGGVTTEKQRKVFAKAAFGYTSEYDTHIHNYFHGARFADNLPEEGIDFSIATSYELRYGENPHQEAKFYGSALTERFEILHGKQLGYNNILDLDAACNLIEDFDEPTAAIIKHNTPCGVASADTILEAYTKALASDPVSAFGGIVVVNRAVDKALAEAMNTLFIEVLIAPDYSEEALEILMSKKNRRLLKDKIGFDSCKYTFRSAVGGLLAQGKDSKVEEASELQATSDHRATDEQIADLLFAMKIVKHCKSNAIVLVKDKQLVGAGYGQTSRVDALRQAIEKARAMGFDTEGVVLSSDAFFPFSDCVEIANKAGISAIIQPGGSVRDEESIDFAREHGIPMYMTGIRHFKH
ncbi:Bifunctional purine biosynthesis protein PurH [Porphyromonas levii]|nr:Bifunctional purine biosynthesis protein PurH [Porphyromonas levii]